MVFEALILLGLAAVTMGAAPARTCEPLRVMSYNIRLDLASDGINRWANRRDQFIGQIRLMSPAILGLQEVVPGQKSDLEAALPGYDFLGVARDDGRSKGEFSNLAIVATSSASDQAGPSGFRRHRPFRRRAGTPPTRELPPGPSSCGEAMVAASWH